MEVTFEGAKMVAEGKAREPGPLLLVIPASISFGYFIKIRP